MTTIRDTITGALRLIEEVGAGETPTSESLNDGLYSLKSMISSWSIQGGMVFTKSTDLFSLVSGTSSYSIGATGDFATARPLDIDYITISSGGVDFTLEEMTEQEYAGIAIKTVQGMPYAFYYDGNYPNGNIKFYPTPSENYVITIYSNKPLSEFTSVNEQLIAPEGYERAFRYNLAVEIAPEYGKQASASVASIAIESKNAVKSQNNKNGAEKMRVDSFLTGRSKYDIYTDWQ